MIVMSGNINVIIKKNKLDDLSLVGVRGGIPYKKEGKGVSAVLVQELMWCLLRYN